jgi:hypothetical protein
MKTLALLAITALLIPVAASAQPTDRDIALPFPSASLQEMLAYLNTSYALKFSYNNEQIPLQQKLTLTPGTTRLNQLLQIICEQTNLEYRITGDQIVLRAKTRPSNVVVQGSVIDAANRPLAYVSITLQGGPKGTITNDAGMFSMAIDHKDAPITLLFSCIGYKSERITISLPISEKLRVYLEPETIQLAAVEVHAKTGLSILSEALARIDQNYDTGAISYTLFVRDLTESNGDPIGVSEAVHQAYRGTGPTPARQLSFVKGRRDKDYAAYQKILSTFPRWTGFDLWTDLDLIFKNDLAMPREEESFLSKKYLQQHDFELLGISRLHDRDVYVIEFNQKDRYKNKSLYTGKLFIDTETLAFVRIESGLSPKGIKHSRFFGTTRAMAIIFGYAECRIQDIKTAIDYTPLHNKWYIRAMNIDVSFIVAKTSKALALDMHLKGDIIVTDMELANPKPLPADAVMDRYDSRNRLYLYDNAFWNGYTTIATDHQIDEAFATIAGKNRRTTFDANFWRRFEPYKSKPALMPRVDSLAPTHTDHTESKAASIATGKARHAVLTQTYYTTHFVLAHTAADSLTAIRIGQLLEDHYARILRDFDLNTLPEPVLAEIYPSIEDYHFAIGKNNAPPSDAGMATGNTTFKLVSPRNPGTYHTTASLELAAIHEFAHCVHYCFVASLDTDTHNNLTQQTDSPWLFEALASYEAGQFYNPTRFAYLKEGHHPTLQELNDVDANGKIYDLGFVLIEYIIKSSGKEKLLNLIRHNGNVAQTLNKTEAEFEKDFYQYIQQTYLSQ